MIPRTATSELLDLARGYPVIVVVGPRQAGKTTLARATFSDHPYLSLEDPDVLRFATDDPRGFLEQVSDGAVLDEVQRAPHLLSYLQGMVDADPSPGRFILTGSSQLDVLSGVTQSLAGRAAILELLPFSLQELAADQKAPKTVEDLLHQGLYPPIYDRGLDPRRWYGNYTRTYVERDLRQLINVRDLSTFQTFVRLCAGRTGQLLNLSSLASDAGITHNTAKAWISALEASFLIKQVRPFFANFGKRLVKTPKLYFLDVGLASWLLEISEPAQLRTHPLRGALFETWVMTELIKARTNRGLVPNVSFWRDRHGLEIDCLLDHGTSISLIEVKAGKTVPAGALSTLRKVRQLARDAREVDESESRSETSDWLVYGGDRTERRTDATVIGWQSIGELVDAVG